MTWLFTKKPEPSNAEKIAGLAAEQALLVQLIATTHPPRERDALRRITRELAELRYRESREQQGAKA